MARILITPASVDYDPTEVAIPRLVLSAAGHEVSFATADGAPARPDDLMLTGRGLDPWAFIPGLAGLRGIGRILGANADARRAHELLEKDARFQKPLRFADLGAADWDALVLPGGHRARGIRPYLEDLALRRFVVGMFEADKVVGAICHGAVVAARAVPTSTQRSVLFGRKTTSLTWPRSASRPASLA
jgi:putative intracellular protease/amidase